MLCPHPSGKNPCVLRSLLRKGPAPYPLGVWRVDHMPPSVKIHLRDGSCEDGRQDQNSTGRSLMYRRGLLQVAVEGRKHDETRKPWEESGA